MSYSRVIIDGAYAELQKRRDKSEKEQKEALKRAYSLIPELEDIDKELSGIGIKIFGATLQGKDGLKERIDELKAHNLALQEKRASLLVSAGLGADYTELKFVCDKCQDTGHVGMHMCSCLRALLISLQMEASGIGSLIEAQSFETFNLELYPENDREHMRQVLCHLKDYVQSFDTDKCNMLFVGGTGLGKTHLSTAVAKSLIEKGYNVVYETSTNMFADFESDRFRDRFSGEESKSDKYMGCDLLIVDDLGTEIISNYTISCLYNIINTRLNKNLPIILNTNLSSKELRRIYNDRITSRIFGEFKILSFGGEDVRYKKRKNS
ncbi:MAG: ATP-binding protein [Clostridia bacterium]|nr:ATP-binding protein [Clostridia bacterium]